MTTGAKRSSRRKLGLSAKVLIGFALGIGCGIFFGELADSLAIFGDAFVGLLQMTVLPYVVVSLIAGLGRLSVQQGRKLAISGGLMLLILSLVGLALVVSLPLAFPNWESSSFFSTTRPSATGTGRRCRKDMAGAYPDCWVWQGVRAG